MDPASLIWVAAAVVATAVAARLRSVVPLPISAAASVAFAAQVLGGGLAMSIILFVTVFLVGRWVIRPVLRSKEDEPRARSGSGSLVGVPAVVIERISNEEAIGCVKIDDELWTARSYGDGQPIEPGTRVHVVEVRGATAVVSP